MLSLASAAYRAVLEHARGGYPLEVCGLLLGRVAGATRRVSQARSVANVDRERAADRYAIDPLEYLAVEDAARGLGLEIVGVYHSHPDHPSRPSDTDRARAVEVWGDTESWSYLILEVVSGKVASARSWVLEGRVFREEMTDSLSSGETMTITVKIPTPLRPHAQGKDQMALQGRTVREVLDNLCKEYEGIQPRIRDETGAVRKYVNLFVNQEDVRFLNGLDTELKDGDVISIIPAVAGGMCGVRTGFARLRSCPDGARPILEGNASATGPSGVPPAAGRPQGVQTQG